MPVSWARLKEAGTVGTTNAMFGGDLLAAARAQRILAQRIRVKIRFDDPMHNILEEADRGAKKHTV